MTKCRVWILSALVLIGCLACRPEGERGVNLLFILSDQHRAEAMACSGHPLVQTPNLDRLAAEGVRFGSATVQAPLCVPSRASLFTGSYPQLHRATNNISRLPPEQLTWAEHLREQGYRTRSIGRVHGIYDGCEHVLVPDKARTYTFAPDAAGQPGGKECPVSAEEHWETRIADEAIEQLRQLSSGASQPRPSIVA